MWTKLQWGAISSGDVTANSWRKQETALIIDPSFCAVPIYTAAESKNTLYRCWFARSNQLGLHRTCYYCWHKDVKLSVTSRAICRLVPPANHHLAEFAPRIIWGAKLQWKPLHCYHDMSLPVGGLSPKHPWLGLPERLLWVRPDVAVHSNLTSRTKSQAQLFISLFLFLTSSTYSLTLTQTHIHAR